LIEDQHYLPRKLPDCNDQEETQRPTLPPAENDKHRSAPARPLFDRKALLARRA
jgi:hypothetical protein